MDTFRLNRHILSILALVLFTTRAFAITDEIHPNSVQVSSEYTLSQAVVSVDDTVTVTRTFINNEASSLTSFYMLDVLPDEISLATTSVEINSSPVVYDFPTPVSSSSYNGYTEYQWVLDYPGINGTYDISVQPHDTVVVVYQLTSNTVGTYDLPLHTFIGHNGTTGLFGYSDSLSLQFDVSLGIDDELELPNSFSLEQNYPNPFNPSTIIEFAVPYRTDVKLNIYNSIGQQIRTLVDKSYSAGTYQVSWDSKDNSGKSVSSGVYLYKLQTADFDISKKMLLLK